MRMFSEAAESVLHSLLTSDYGECLHISPFLQSQLHVRASNPHHISDQAISQKGYFLLFLQGIHFLHNVFFFFFCQKANEDGGKRLPISYNFILVCTKHTFFIYCTLTQCLMQELRTIEMSAWQDDKRKSKPRERMTWLEFLPYQFPSPHFIVLYATCPPPFSSFTLECTYLSFKCSIFWDKMIVRQCAHMTKQAGTTDDTSCLCSHVLHLKSPSMILIRTSKSHEVPQMKWTNAGLPGLTLNNCIVHWRNPHIQ